MGDATGSLKALVYAVVGGVITALIIFLGQGYLEAQQQKNDFALTFWEYNPPIRLTKKQFDPVIQKFDGDADAYFYVNWFKLRNAGDQPLQNQKVTIYEPRPHILSMGALAFGTMRYPGLDQDTVTGQVKDGKLELNYKLIDAGQEHLFWILTTQEPVFDIVASRPGLTIDEFRQNYAFEEPERGTDWLGLGLLALGMLASVVAGAWLSHSSTKAELKKRGHELAELLKVPEERNDG